MRTVSVTEMSQTIVFVICHGMFLSVFAALLAATFNNLKTGLDVLVDCLLVVAGFAVVLVLIGCDVTVKGETTHRVEGEATVKMQVEADFCKDVPAEQKMECLKTFEKLVEMMNEAQKRDQGGV